MALLYVKRDPKKVKHYYTEEENEEVLAALRVWRPKRIAAIQAGCPTDAPVPEIVGAAILKTVTHLASNRGYSKWPYRAYREEMIGNALIALMAGIHSFDPNRVSERTGKINFFGYVTFAASNAFNRIIEAEEIADYIRNRSYVDTFGFSADGSSNLAANIADQNHLDLVANTEMGMDMHNRCSYFEAKMEAKREKEREKRLAKKPQTSKSTLDIFWELAEVAIEDYEDKDVDDYGPDSDFDSESEE